MVSRPQSSNKPLSDMLHAEVVQRCTSGIYRVRVRVRVRVILLRVRVRVILLRVRVRVRVGTY